MKTASPLRICLLLDLPELCGGVLNAVRIAGLLRRDGHAVTVSAGGPRPAWLDWPGAWHNHQGFQSPPPGADLLIATYWTTVTQGLRMAYPRLIHFCQGYEGDAAHLRDRKQEIEALYRTPLATWVVSEALRQRLLAFSRGAALIPPPPSPLFRPALRFRPHARPRIVLPGMWEADMKNIPVALRALARLRATGFAFELIRISILPPRRDETELLPADRYLMNLAPEAVAALYRRADLLLFPSLPTEGFGLPALEACRSGLPAVLSRIPPLREFTDRGVASAAPDDVEGFVRLAREILTSPRRWRAARAAGLSAARAFSDRRTLAALRSALGSLDRPSP